MGRGDGPGISPRAAGGVNRSPLMRNSAGENWQTHLPPSLRLLLTCWAGSLSLSVADWQVLCPIIATYIPFKCWGYFCPSKAHGHKDFWEPSKPCHVGTHWKVLSEYSQMRTNVPVFQSFFLKFFCILLYWSNQPPAAWRCFTRPQYCSKERWKIQTKVLRAHLRGMLLKLNPITFFEIF